ncbi:kinase suppressor of Ras 2 [Culicoides brevitarsis]|uniref:kinase suppressor of Ras 2 n=1 Tax=Culicoides brevitarsis TaxID=469753 RepID=UPI00307C1DE7
MMDCQNETNLKRGLDVVQRMIDISADRLEGLRTQCNSSAELTQQEIRTLEVKLVKMFSELLVRKEKLPQSLQNVSTNNREIKQWLRVVGLNGDSLNVMLHRINSLEMLICTNDAEIRAILEDGSTIRDEEARILIRAMNCLRISENSIKTGLKEQSDLFWDSWDRQQNNHIKTGISPKIERGKTNNKGPRYQNMFSTNTDNLLINRIDQQTENTLELSPPEDGSFHTLTPSPSPPDSPANSFKTRTKGFPTTPPPKKKHQTLVSSNTSFGTQSIHLNNTTAININSSNVNIGPNNEQRLLSKSQSHELQLTNEDQINQVQYNSQKQIAESSYSISNANSNIQQANLSNKVVNGNSILPESKEHIPSNTTFNSTSEIPVPTTRSRLHTEPVLGSDMELGDSNISYSLNVPRSPCTPITRGMGHMIQHRFTKNFRVTTCTCDLCNKQMFFGFKCTECKYRCHKDCKPNVPPSCGLPQEFVDEFKKTLQSENVLSNTSPSLGGRNLLSSNRREKTRIQAHNVHGQDSSSAGSSCNSSSPSSPGLLISFHSQTPGASNKSQFNFPEVNFKNSSNGSNTFKENELLELSEEQEKQKLDQMQVFPLQSHSNTSGLNSHRQNLSELTDTRKSNDSDRTVSLTGSTSTSTDSDRTPIRLDSMEERDTGNWPRQNSLSLKEWDIPYDDLKLLEKIGKGRFGTVHRALWHGDVAVKILKPDYLDDESTLEAFKLEVATFKKTRHENLVLFMGACMKPPRLAIVTSHCKGSTLYTHIHLRKDKFNLNRTTLVAQQISQGMGYLHARGIVHKDLKTKNIFLENGKVIITDFGLFSATKLTYTEHGLGIAREWLCYLAPELIKGLKPYRPIDEDLPFSKASDVHAFGTVWYELLCGDFPFKSQPHESVIWQVGRGMKQTLGNLQASRDIKDILMMCWSFEVETRPDFATLLQLLERLPKKRLARSPSHPIQLSRSAESVF